MKKRYAIITDIHGNKEALESILDDIKKQNIDETYCLGDTIGIGPESKECIDILIKNKIKSILGKLGLNYFDKVTSENVPIVRERW